MAILNALLQPTDAPVTSERGTVGYLWDTTSDRGMVRSVQIQDASIGSAKITDFSFNQGAGGTLTLGGTANGNGVLSIDNSSGSALITADNTGITIRGTSGTAIIDSTGLISLNNFARSETHTDALNQAITGTALTDITNASLTFSLQRNTVVMLLADVRSYGAQASGTTNWDATYRITYNIDGTEQDTSAAITEEASKTGSDKEGVTHIASSSMHKITTLGSGSHTVKLQSYLTNTTGNGQAIIYNYSMSYLVLGN